MELEPAQIEKLTYVPWYLSLKLIEIKVKPSQFRETSDPIIDLPGEMVGW